jgi:hypothetical protein
MKRGELTIVLGELHANWNTFEQELFVQEFPDRARFREALLHDLPSGRIGPVIPAGAAGRCHAAHYSEHPLDVTIEHDAVRSARPRVQTIPISALFVRERAGDGELELVTRDGRRRWDIAAAIEYLLVENEASMLPSRAHTPRIAIDGFVLQREAWRVPASSCTFARAKDPLDRFLGARRWAAELGVPRHAFFKRTGELKPWFVDFASPLYIEQLCKAVRGAAETDVLSISEMYPSLDECWLVDREGRRYTSELRMIAVDELTPRSSVLRPQR